jgi:hypothetical protein
MQHNPPQQSPKHAPNQLRQLGLREIGFVCQKTLFRRYRLPRTHNSPQKHQNYKAKPKNGGNEKAKVPA